MMNKSRGRRRGSPDTREDILAAARRRFLADGYAKVTMRSIATEAGVDAALISYFFGSKKGLFGAVLGLLENPPEVLAAALPGDPAGLPERILRAQLAAWDDPVGGPQLEMMVRTAVQEPELSRLLKDVIWHEMIDRIAAHAGGPDASGRAAAFGTQLAGVVFARYILAFDAVAAMPTDEFVARHVPALRLALFPPRRPRTF